MSKKKILITGVHGAIGGATYCRLSKLHDKYDLFGTDRRTDIREDLLPQFIPNVPKENFFHGDISDQSFAMKTVAGMDVVVHLAANASPRSTWESILTSNLAGTYSVFDACRQTNVARIIYASSIMTVFGYYTREPYSLIKEGRFRDIQKPIPIIDCSHPVWPTEPYSASKVWGEALARAYSVTHGMSILCLRIGSVPATNNPTTWGKSCWSTWCSLTDIAQLIECCIKAPSELKFEIFFGISNNKYCWVDIDHARKTVGYRPECSADMFVQYDDA